MNQQKTQVLEPKSGHRFKEEPQAETSGLASASARLKTPLLIIGIILLLLAAIYGYGVIHFTTHFGYNTTIDGRNMTHLTARQAEQRLALNAHRFEMVIIGREGFSERITAVDVGIYYVPDGQIADLLKSQDPLLWPLRLLPQASYQTQPSFGFDKSLLAQYIAENEAFDPVNMRPPTDATAIFINGSYNVEEEDIGTLLNLDAVLSSLSMHLTKGIPECDLDQSSCYQNPAVFADDPDLLEQVSDYNAFAPFEIIYDFGTFSETLDASIAIDWFTPADGLSRSLDYSALDAWLDGFCERHNTLGEDRTFLSYRGDWITIGSGTYGWLIDRSAERSAIIAALSSRTSVTREPYYIQRAAVHVTEPGAPDWGGTYIEIDQTLQKLFYFVDGDLVLETDIVTGLPTPMWTTPCGVFRILTRVSPARLRGPIQEDGNPMWDSTVQFWMGVTYGGVGIHDAYWQPWFGGTRYQYGGTHGCINLPYYSARDLFYMVEVGTPVIIHW